MTPADLYQLLLGGTAVLLVAVLAVRLSTRSGLPSLLLYLAIGLGIGEAGLGLGFDDVTLVQNAGLVALALILAEGGLTTRWSVIRPALGLALVLATVGVAVSVSVVAAVAHLVVGLELRTAVLLGAVVSSTDAAAVFSVLRSISLRSRPRAVLEAESGFNDAPVVILVTFVVSDAWEQASVLSGALEMIYQLVVGALVGLAVGRGGQLLLGRSALPATGLYPVATLSIALLSFAAAGALGASGFLAVYLTGLWLGNARLPHRQATLGFAEGSAWLAQIGLFVMLGLVAVPTRLPDSVVPALVVGVALLLVARPLSVVVCALPFGVPWREQLFLSWAGLRGAVPIVLAAIGVAAGVPAGVRVFDIVFVLVVVFTALQAPTLPLLARWLRVADPAPSRDVEVDAAPLEEAGAELLQVTVPPESRLVGVYLPELRLPAGSAVSLVVRAGRSFVPTEHTTIARGDRLLVVVPIDVREATERRLRAVSRAGKLAGWTGDPGGGRRRRGPARDAADDRRDR
jgi:potassium/hydrogen antiporter